MWQPRPSDLPTGRVPQDQPLIATNRRQASTVWAERQSRHVCAMLCQRCDLVTRPRVPDLDDAALVPAGDEPAPGVISDRKERLRVALEFHQRPTVFQIP